MGTATETLPKGQQMKPMPPPSKVTLPKAPQLEIFPPVKVAVAPTQIQQLQPAMVQGIKSLLDFYRHKSEWDVQGTILTERGTDQNNLLVEVRVVPMNSLGEKSLPPFTVLVLRALTEHDFDRNLDFQVFSWQKQTVTGLVPPATFDLLFTFEPDPKADPKHYYYHVTLDADHAVDELNKGNNCTEYKH